MSCSNKVAPKISPYASVLNGFVNPEIKMKGKTVLITGANKGIGLETAKNLANRDARVILACRDKEKAEYARNEILQCVPGSDVEAIQLDLASFPSVRDCANEFLNREKHLDVLINNACAPFSKEQYTQDGIEMQFGVNHVGHFLLTNMLLPLMKESKSGRIVVVSSMAHECGKDIDWNNFKSKKKYDPIEAHAQSKLANMLFMKELSYRLQGTGVTCNAVTPGCADTDFWTSIEESYKDSCYLWRKILSWGISCAKKHAMKPVSTAAQTSVFCAIAPELENVSGVYFADCNIAKESKASQNAEAGRKLWEASEKWVEMQF